MTDTCMTIRSVGGNDYLVYAAHGKESTFRVHVTEVTSGFEAMVELPLDARLVGRGSTRSAALADVAAWVMGDASFAEAINTLLETGALPRKDRLPEQPVDQSMQWRSMDTAPKDGTEVLLKTPSGVVSAWFCDEPAEGDGSVYDWICYDDKFTIDGHDSSIQGWMPVPCADDPASPSEEIGPDGKQWDPDLKMRVDACNPIDMLQGEP
jgi:hypothetical protein